MLKIIKVETDENGDTVEHYLPTEDIDVTRDMLMRHIGYLATLAAHTPRNFIKRFGHLFNKDEQTILKELQKDGYVYIYGNVNVYARVRVVTGLKPSLEFKIIHRKGGCLQEYKTIHLNQLCQEAQLEASDVEEILKQIISCLRFCFC